MVNAIDGISIFDLHRKPDLGRKPCRYDDNGVKGFFLNCLFCHYPKRDCLDFEMKKC